MTNNSNPWFVDLFAGCGGFSKGFLDAGYRHLMANEIWPTAVETYKKNIGSNIICGDIRDDKYFSQLVESTKDHQPLVVIGGPPCQGFSQAGNRNPIDPRGQLWKKYVEYINIIQPIAFVMENVKGLISMKHIDSNLTVKKRREVEKAAEVLQQFKDLSRYARQRDLSDDEIKLMDSVKSKLSGANKKVSSHLTPLLPSIIDTLSNCGVGYQVKYMILNAANYGVPQLRERIIIIGIRNEVIKNIGGDPKEELLFHPIPEYVDFDDDNHPKIPKEFQTYLKDTTNLKPYETVERAIKDLAEKPEDKELQHVFMKHKKEFAERIGNTTPGKSVFPSYSDGWYKLLPDRPSRTVKENHGGVHCNPWRPRTLSPRELARLQSFEDAFMFDGRKSEVLVQIGNAVPPLLAKAIAKGLLKILYSYNSL